MAAGDGAANPRFRLVATDGTTVTQDSHRGDWQVVLFVAAMLAGMALFSALEHRRNH